MTLHQPPHTHPLARLTRLALCAATALVLGACAQMSNRSASDDGIPLPPSIAQAQSQTQSATAEAARQPSTTAPSLSIPADAAAPNAAAAASASADEPAEGAEAAGPPTDPLAPDNIVVLDDASAHADIWSRIRAGFAMPRLDSDIVRDHEQWYTRRPDYVQRMTDRGGRYLFHIVEEVEKRGMPSELALLPFIESAFNPQALSSARASGMWQFMPATGRDFDLRQNIFRDDRRDVLASTRAALDYLQRLYGMFGDWQLALAAYNWGEGNVSKAIARNLRAGKPADYANLSMPMETQHYVPKLEAVRNIVADPARYGLTLPDIQNHPYFLSVPIRRDMDVDLAARLAGMSLDEFKSLNPQHNKPVILAAGTPQLLLPYDNADRFVRNLASHRGPLASWTAWVVPRNMRPGDAAQQVGMSESVLRDINRIPPRMLVKAGSTLLVPRGERRQEDVSEHLAENAAIALTPDAPALRRVNVKARKDDTLASLAKRYRVSSSQMAQWNKLSPNAKLASGATLVVYQAPGKAATTTAKAASLPTKTASSAGSKKKATQVASSRAGNKKQSVKAGSKASARRVANAEGSRARSN